MIQHVVINIRTPAPMIAIVVGRVSSIYLDVHEKKDYSCDVSSEATIVRRLLISPSSVSKEYLGSGEKVRIK